MVRFNVIAFTHHTIGVEEVGKFHLEENEIQPKMQHIKEQLNIDEIMYVSTCNRVEFIFVGTLEVNSVFLAHFLNEFNPDWNQNHIQNLIDNCKSWNGVNAVNHLIEVASSLDSMVIGEREIITQMRSAFEFARIHKLSGDMIRIVMRQVIQTAKKVYTETDIAAKPVSVVSLAYHQLKKRNLSSDARIVFIGAGVTNNNLGRFLSDHGFTNFTVFNRSIEKAEKLAEMLGGDAYKLEDIQKFKKGFDLLVCCTSAKVSILTLNVYQSLLNGEDNQKIVIDLAVPSDLNNEVKSKFDVDHISVDFLKSISDNNLKERKRELINVRQIIYQAVEEFKELFKMRQVEIKMRSIPEKVKEIKSRAINEVFSKDLENLDDDSRELVDKILNYMEKKYVSVPMLMAKEMVAKKVLENED